MSNLVPLVFEIDSYEGTSRFRMDTVVLRDEGEQILIDAGTPGIITIIEKAFSGASLKIEDLTGIVITHQDQDHIGSLAAIKRKATKAKVYASAVQVPGISGREKPLRLQWEEAEYESLPDAVRKQTPPPASLWPKVEYADIDVILHHGDRFPWCGGTEIIFTEGHMPGHISLYLDKTKTFIAGDALAVREDRLTPPGKFTCDIEAAKKNLRDIAANYEIETIVCYHGGFWRGDGSEVLRNIT